MFQNFPNVPKFSKFSKFSNFQIFKFQNFKKYSELRGATSISDAFFSSVKEKAVFYDDDFDSNATKFGIEQKSVIGWQ